MPKNMFQRPQPVTHSRNVPRHGAPVPMRKVEARKVAQPKADATLSLTELQALLKTSKH